MESKLKLPSFRSPPLDEVALAVNFEAIENLNIQHFGFLYQKYQKSLPLVETHAPTQSQIERFGLMQQNPREVNFEIVQNPDVHRVWFVSEDQNNLIQFQKDRFIRNWRKRSESDIYPRYEDYTRPQFIADYKTFLDFVGEYNLGSIAVNQCEVTYVNIISGNGFDLNHGALEEVIANWNPKYQESISLPTESVRFSSSHIINLNEEPVGRLHVNLQPAFNREDGKQVFRLSIIARGKPNGTDLESVLEFFDMGRGHIVETFAQITSKKMHDIWGREN